MSLPFESATGNLDLKSLAGAAVLAHVGGCYPAMRTAFGVKPVLQTNLVVITGPQAGLEILDKRVFNAPIVRALRSYVGRAILGRVDVDNSGTNTAVVWLKPSTLEEEKAAKWVADNPGRCEELITLAVTAFDANPQDQSGPRAATQSWNPQQNRTERPSDPPPWSSSTEDEQPNY